MTVESGPRILAQKDPGFGAVKGTPMSARRSGADGPGAPGQGFMVKTTYKNGNPVYSVEHMDGRA